MKLTKKIAFFIVVICILLSLSFFLLYYHIILAGPVEEQKSLFAQKIIDGAFCILDNETLRLSTICEDWATRDSMYDYASQTEPPGRLEKEPDLKDVGLSLFLVVNRNKEIIHLRGYRHVSKQSLTFDLLKEKKGCLWEHLFRTFNKRNSDSGMVLSEYGPMIVVSCPIFRSDNSGPQNGRLLIGRTIDKTFEERIKRTIRAEVRLLNVGRTGKNRRAPPIQADEKKGNRQILVEESTACMVIRYPVEDVEGRHIFTIKVAARKQVFEIFDKAGRLFFLLMITGFILLGVIFYFIMNRLVVRRVKRISTITENIISFDDLSLRIPASYRDEITLLGQNINRMLERLQTEKIRKEEVERMEILNEKLIFLGRVTANITHEINNPLFAIDNSLQIIKKYLPGDNKMLNEVVQVVEKEIKRVKHITQNMHKFAIPGIETFTPADITAILKGAINVLKWSNQIKGTTIEYMKSGRSFPLYCHQEAIQQVFLNIILNAIEAMEGKGKLVIDVNKKNGEYQVDFIDNGPGFSDAVKAEMFKPFRSTKPGKGSGLGLNISYHIISNHGGTISLDETYKGGARLMVNIPAEYPNTNTNTKGKGGSTINGKSVPTTGR
jgi:signal transduction histidine kinase